MRACLRSGARTVSYCAIPLEFRHGLVAKLDMFFAQLLQDFSYAMEIRNAGMLGPLYRDMLASPWSGTCLTTGRICLPLLSNTRS